jgi:hypothetical protein
MGKGFNINRQLDEDERSYVSPYQDILDVFYRKNEPKIAGIRAHPREESATLEYDERYLAALFKGALYPEAVRRRPELKEFPPSFLFDTGDVIDAAVDYHTAARDLRLPKHLRGLYLHEFLFRDYGTHENLHSLSYFLHYHVKQRSLASYKFLDQDGKDTINYVLEKWDQLPSADPVADIDDLVPVVERLNEFTALFSDLVPVQDRYDMTVEDEDDAKRPWSPQSLLPVIDDFFTCLTVFPPPYLPAVLTSVKMWREVFIRYLRRQLNLEKDDMSEYTTIDEVDHYRSSYRGFYR